MNSPNNIAHYPMTEVVPVEVADALRDFMLDKRTGNIVLNVKDGVILGLKTEVFTSFNLRT